VPGQERQSYQAAADSKHLPEGQGLLENGGGQQSEGQRSAGASDQTDGGEVPAGSVSVDSWYYNGNLVFNIIPHGRIIPYATGGAGLVTLDVEGGDRENRFAGNFGGGVLARVTDRIGIRFDVLDYVYEAKDLDTQSTAALGVPVSFDRTIHDLALDFGVSIAF
jgi:hypothetical protein